MKRDSCTQQQAEAKVAAQMPLSTKSAKAQLVIDNSQDLAHIELQVILSYELFSHSPVGV